MRKFIEFLSYWIGSFLIGLAKLISGLRTMLLMMLTMSIVMGIAAITMIGFADLVSPETRFLSNVYWDVFVVVIGSATMWLGYSKMMKFSNSPK